jgi:hypothetical protein
VVGSADHGETGLIVERAQLGVDDSLGVEQSTGEPRRTANQTRSWPGASATATRERDALSGRRFSSSDGSLTLGLRPYETLWLTVLGDSA